MSEEDWRLEESDIKIRQQGTEFQQEITFWLRNHYHLPVIDILIYTYKGSDWKIKRKYSLLHLDSHPGGFQKAHGLILSNWKPSELALFLLSPFFSLPLFTHTHTHTHILLLYCSLNCTLLANWFLMNRLSLLILHFLHIFCQLLWRASYYVIQKDI